MLCTIHMPNSCTDKQKTTHKMVTSVAAAHTVTRPLRTKDCSRLTTSNLHRHEPLANDAPKMGPGNELLPHIAAFGEANSIQAVQIILQWDGMAYSDSPISVQTAACMPEPLGNGSLRLCNCMIRFILTWRVVLDPVRQP